MIKIVSIATFAASQVSAVHWSWSGLIADAAQDLGGANASLNEAIKKQENAAKKIAEHGTDWLDPHNLHCKYAFE